MKNGKILIIDDDQDMVEALRAILESHNYTVTTGADREEGMQKLQAESPDLIILDVMMSTWQDGFEMARTLKQGDQFKDIPILMVTAAQERTGINFKATAGDPDWCPVDGFLDKPVPSDVLLAEIEKLLPG